MRDQPLSKDKIADKAKQHLQPKNCLFATQQVNSEIWNLALGSKERSLDLKIQRSQNLANKTTIATLKATNDLLNLKSKKGNKKELIKSAITSQFDSLALLATANAATAQLRRDLMIKNLAVEQRGISKDVPNGAKLLFGDDLNKKLTEMAGANKLKIRPFSKNTYRPYKNPKGQVSQGYKQYPTKQSRYQKTKSASTISRKPKN